MTDAEVDQIVLQHINKIVDVGAGAGPGSAVKKLDYYRDLVRAGAEFAEKAAAARLGEPEFWGSKDGYWVEARYKSIRPDADRFTEAFYSAKQVQNKE